MSALWNNEDLLLLVGLPIFGFALYLWAQALRHMIGMLKHTQRSVWVVGAFGAFALACPFLFTDKGNTHRVQCLAYTGAFVAICATPFLVLFILETVSHG